MAFPIDVRLPNRATGSSLSYSIGKAVIESLGIGTKVAAKGIAEVRLSGYDGKLEWTHNKEDVVIELPNKKPCDYAFVSKLLSTANYNPDFPSDP